MIDELEGEFFIINSSGWRYLTICYGILYDFNNKTDNWSLKTLITDERASEIYYENLWHGEYEDDDFEKPDKRYYPRPDRELINRIFEYEWIN